MRTDEFDYELPPDKIAQTPAEPRDASRLMVVHRQTEEIEHRIFRDIVEYLRPGDLLVLNQTRVIPARLFGRKAATGGSVELLLLNQRQGRTWEALVRGKGLRPGTRIELGAADTEGTASEGKQRIGAEVMAETESGGRLIRFDEPVETFMGALGVIPLPPYIHEPLEDPERYQTVYGQIEGSVAASTAGLHFTPELLVDVRRMGAEMAFVTLHIGLDTFRPVKEERIEDHQIHTEWYELTAPVAEQINRARLEGRRVIAVGTTVVRVLESAGGGVAPAAVEGCGPEGQACGWRTVSAHTGPTDLFIYPGYRFRVVETMITNFHLPRSTLLMLVSAFAGRDLILHAYQEAIRLGYRFFSFGDAMLLL
ncbi:MAG: tRNA preQ1(34) S-adenosylmethionine ribosyltransferase-isomerase QueA [Anaerolineae bacterium]|jgi:S-adenosylmethionine:tRNA ribosyltransferase-isomerase